MNNPILAVEHLSVTFNHRQKVVDDISFAIHPGETFALVGRIGFRQIDHGLVGAQIVAQQCPTQCRAQSACKAIIY